MPWVDEWEILHKAFHMSLISGCGSRRMQEMSARLYDESERYRRLYWNYQLPKEELISEHQALVDIVLSRDAELARALVIGNAQQRKGIEQGQRA